jgi:eukaryotic-like serine/threonine-protein kinase
MIGRTLGHYRIESKLGEGGMGVVYKAFDTHLDRAVAIKVLPPDAVANPERRRRFVQEAKAASALSHPNIVTVHDIGEDSGVAFLVMEYVSGTTLEAKLREGPLPMAEVIEYGVQAAGSIGAAHAIGIVHRDLKPGNLMLTAVTAAGPSHLKVLDFGLAKLRHPAEAAAGSVTRTAAPGTEIGMVMGTAPYMSPEQAQGHEVDARSDVFSLASVIYEMLTGRSPFGAGKAVTAAIIYAPPQPLLELRPGTPKHLVRIVERALSKDPAARYPSCAEMARELDPGRRWRRGPARRPRGELGVAGIRPPLGPRNSAARSHAARRARQLCGGLRSRAEGAPVDPVGPDPRQAAP